ncbi:MAG: PEP-CTERM sorting domain-containing protein [Candidatus Binatia bacterium]
MNRGRSAEGVLWRAVASAAVAVCLLSPGLSSATGIAVTGSDLSGARSTATGGGLVGTDEWANGALTLSWDITFDGDTGIWSYSYTLSGAPEVSHWLLETSGIINEENRSEFIFNVAGPVDDVVGPKLWPGDPDSPNATGAGDNGGNPNLPGDMYAIKFDISPNDETVTFSFDSTQLPIWGDFYAKDGSGGGGKNALAGVPTAWNLGFGTEPLVGGPFTNWVPIPDTETHPPGEAPEPGSLLLLGTGLLGLAALRRRSRPEA